MMEPADDGTPSSSTEWFGRTKLQSMEDFMAEQDELDALQAAGSKAYLLDKPTKKQKKATLHAQTELYKARANEATMELGDVNWVGRLLEYRNAHPKLNGLTYAEAAVGQTPPRFTCTVVINESSQHFGGDSVSFLKKKDAKRFASKKAIDWLIENNYMPADGSVKFPKTPLSAVVKNHTPGGEVSQSPTETPKSNSYAGQIPELCHRLGFSPPTYDIKKAHENAPLWNGYAHFGGDPRITGKVGVVENVFGKNNAKEEIAKEVLLYLKGIERQRLAADDDDDRKRKRASASSDIEEIGGK